MQSTQNKRLSTTRPPNRNEFITLLDDLKNRLFLSGFIIQKTENEGMLNGADLGYVTF